MTIFKLPDLGEGLPDAEIHEWFLKIGDHINADEPLVLMETAKAVVEVPSPQSGIIATLNGKPGDVIKTGDPLVTFEADTPRKDQGTVVGNLEVSTTITEDKFSIGSSQNATKANTTTPTIRHLAKKLGVNLNNVHGSGEHGLITRSDIEQAALIQSRPPEGFEPLHGVRRAMLNSMVKSHQEVVPVSIFDEADIQDWPQDSDITIRLIQAIIAATKIEPALNAWFDTQHVARKCFTSVNLGLAIDTADGLFVPVIHKAEEMTAQQLREHINILKRAVADRSVRKEQLQGASLTLSNFGKFSGKYASPIIVPPTVAILAVGRLYEGAVSRNGHIKSHRLLPLSLSFDHRAVTGGEATRFLGAVITALQT